MSQATRSATVASCSLLRASLHVRTFLQEQFRCAYSALFMGIRHPEGPGSIFLLDFGHILLNVLTALIFNNQLLLNCQDNLQHLKYIKTQKH